MSYPSDVPRDTLRGTLTQWVPRSVCQTAILACLYAVPGEGCWLPAKLQAFKTESHPGALGPCFLCVAASVSRFGIPAILADFQFPEEAVLSPARAPECPINLCHHTCPPAAPCLSSGFPGKASASERPSPCSHPDRLTLLGAFLMPHSTGFARM